MDIPYSIHSLSLSFSLSYLLNIMLMRVHGKKPSFLPCRNFVFRRHVSIETLRWKRNSSRFKKKNERLILNSISSPYIKITILKFWILEIFRFLLNASYESYSEKAITNSRFGANYKCGSKRVESCWALRESKVDGLRSRGERDAQGCALSRSLEPFFPFYVFTRERKKRGRGGKKKRANMGVKKWNRRRKKPTTIFRIKAERWIILGDTLKRDWRWCAQRWWEEKCKNERSG